MQRVHQSIKKWYDNGKAWLHATIHEREAERDMFRHSQYSTTSISSSEYHVQGLSLDEAIFDGEEYGNEPPCSETTQVNLQPTEDEDVFGHGFGWDDND